MLLASLTTFIQGGAGKVKLQINSPVVKATIVDLLERELEELKLVKNAAKRETTAIHFVRITLSSSKLG